MSEHEHMQQSKVSSESVTRHDALHETEYHVDFICREDECRAIADGIVPTRLQEMCRGMVEDVMLKLDIEADRAKAERDAAPKKARKKRA